MTNNAHGYLLRQFDLAWQLTRHHLDDLDTRTCLWRPAERGLHVRQHADGSWHADWPEHEGYSLGPSSIAWLSWHLGFWWSMVLDHSFSAGTLVRENIQWPGDADAVRTWIYGLHDAWRAHLIALTDADLQSTERTRWPYTNRPLGDVVAWATVELTKSAAEIGYVRFLYGADETR